MKLDEIKRLRHLIRKSVAKSIYEVMTFMVSNKEFPTMEMIVESILREIAELVTYEFKEAIENNGVDFLAVLFRGPEPSYHCEVSKRVLDPPDK